MTNEELAQRLAKIVSELDAIIPEMDDRNASCSHCGVSASVNRDDFRAKQALSAARQRVSRALGKLLSNTWIGRPLDLVIDRDEYERLMSFASSSHSEDSDALR